MASTSYCTRCLTTFVEKHATCPNLACGAERPANGWGDLLGPGDLLDRHYEIIKPLAVGGAGLTYLAREIDSSGRGFGPELAIKVLYTERDAGPFLRRLSNEAQILQELDHDNIVRCRGFVQRSGHAPYLVTLFEHGGNLAQHVSSKGPLSPTIAAGVIRQILLALDVAHQRDVVHRDLKPENVFLNRPTDADELPLVRVADFGIAKVFGGIGSRLTRLGAFVGTPEYAAPEQFEGMAPTPATDVWAAGGLLYYLISGDPPMSFKHRLDVESSYAQLLEQAPPKLPVSPGSSAEQLAHLQKALDQMMAVEPGDRCSVHQVLEHLESFFGPAALTDSGAPERTGAPAPLEPMGGTPDTSEAPDRVIERKAHSTAWVPVDDGRSADAEESPEASSALPPAAAVASAAVAATTPKTADEAPPAPTSEPPPPPPQATKPAPPTAPPAPPTAPPPPSSGGGFLGLAGAAGALTMVTLASVVGLAIVAGSAYAFGWFEPPQPASVELAPIRIAAAEAVDLDTSQDPDHVRARRRVESTLQGLAGRMRDRCQARQVVPIVLQLDAAGQVTNTPVSRSSNHESWWSCVNRGMTRQPIEHGLGVPVHMTTHLDLR